MKHLTLVGEQWWIATIALDNTRGEQLIIRCDQPASGHLAAIAMNVPAADGARVPPAVGRPQLVGRAREMAALADALAKQPAAILVEGEAGVGKSRLVGEALAADPNLRQRCLVAECPPIREPFTLGPVIEAIRQHVDELDARPLSGLAGALRPLFPEWAALLPELPDELVDVRAARHRLFRALAELLDSLRVALLVVEDVHWADEATLEFLLFLLSRRPAPLGLLVTYRGDDVPAGSLLRRLAARLPADVTRLRLELAPLDVAGTTAVVSSMLDNETVSAEFGAFIHRATGGIPLVVEESVRLMVDRADLTYRDGEWVRRKLGAIEVPPTVRDATLERYARLGADARAVLDAATVLAEPALEAMITAVTDLDPLRAGSGLTDALLCGLLHENERGQLTLRHALAAQALYDAIPGPRRRALHLRAGRVLQGGGPSPLVARLAYHFREAGETDEWCLYAEQTADLALASGDETVAAAALHDLLTNVSLPAATVIRLTGKFPFPSATSIDQLGGLVAQLRALLESAAVSIAERVELHLLMGRLLMMMEEFHDGRAALEEVVAQAPVGSSAALHAMTLLGWPRAATVPAAEHLRWLRRAARVDDTPLSRSEQLFSTMSRATALLLLGEEAGWTEAAILPGETPGGVSDETAGERNHQLAATLQLNLGDAAILWGRYAEARRRLAAARDLAERHQYPRLHGLTLGNQLRLDWLTGAWAGLAARAIALAGDEDAQPLARADGALVAGLIDATNGDYDRAEGRLEHVRAERRRVGAVETYAEAAAALARLQLAKDRVDEAIQATDESLGIIATKGVWLWASDLVPARIEALTMAGRTEEAAALVTAFDRGSRGRDAPAAAAGLVWSQALLAQAQDEPARAAMLFARAATAWAALPRPYDALLAQERQAECLRAVDQGDLAASLLSDVYQGLSGLGVVEAADRIARRLREHGVDIRRTWRRGRRGYGNELSPAELEVVRMVVAGATNRRIAEALSRSPKTIEAQVKSAMRKLRVTSRTALAVAALDSGVFASRHSDPNG